MPESSNRETPTIPAVENRAVKPAGILPKNMQAMVIAGISVIMVGAIAFSGNSTSKNPTKSPAPANATVTDPNQARIAEYRQRLDEQARRLAAEQAQFQQTRQQFAAATGVQAGTPGGATAAYSGADSARNDVSLDQFKGLNQIGETGLRDQVNHHYTQIFGVSLAIGAIAGLAQADTRAGGFQSSSDAYRQGVASSLSQSSLRILDRYLNVLPTLTIREGHRVKVYLSDDLLLPAYNHHRMPADL